MRRTFLRFFLFKLESREKDWRDEVLVSVASSSDASQEAVARGDALASVYASTAATLTSLRFQGQAMTGSAWHPKRAFCVDVISGSPSLLKGPSLR